jgi:hypothetical protein
VCFGLGWIERGALELFQQSVQLHEPLLPVLSDEDPQAITRAGGVPQLAELRLHNGTVWRWNRAVYDPADGGHLRIEIRALPTGPTVVDMMANAAFLVGLALDLSRRRDDAVTRFPFVNAQANFFHAAQRGLDAELLWPDGERASTLPARELVPRLLPLAARGLAAGGVDTGECERLLEVIERRAASGITGASWQRRRLARLEQTLPRREALGRMFGDYLEHSERGTPVHAWPLP